MHLEREKRRPGPCRLVLSHTVYNRPGLVCRCAFTVVKQERDKLRSCVCPYPCLYVLIQPKWHKAAATGGTGGDRLIPPNLFSGIVPSTAPFTMNWRAQMTQIGQAREVCGINYSVCTVERGRGGRRPKDSVSWCLGVGENRWKSIVGLRALVFWPTCWDGHTISSQTNTSSFIFSPRCQYSRRNAENEGLARWENWRTGHIIILRSLCPQRAAVCSRRSSVSNCLCYQFVRRTLVLCSFHGKLSDAGGDGRRADSREISITACRYLRSERAHGSCYDNKQSSICLTWLISARWIGEGLDGLLQSAQRSGQGWVVNSQPMFYAPLASLNSYQPQSD